MADRSISFDLKVGDSLAIDSGRVLLTLLHKSGQTARLGFIVAAGVDFVKGKKALAGAEQARRGLTA